MNVVLLSRTDDCLFKFLISHTTVIPDIAVDCCDRLICRYVGGVHQLHGTDVFIDLHIGENRRRPSCRQYHNCAGRKYGGALVAEFPISQSS